MGHEVVTANDGRQALDMVRQEHYDIILLDIKMPEVDGLEVMSILRQRKSDALIVVITGYATIETAVEAMKAGAYDLLIQAFFPPTPCESPWAGPWTICGWPWKRMN